MITLDQVNLINQVSHQHRINHGSKESNGNKRNNGSQVVKVTQVNRVNKIILGTGPKRKYVNITVDSGAHFSLLVRNAAEVEAINKVKIAGVLDAKMTTYLSAS